MITQCVVFPYAKGDGPSNMALDEAMLGAVADDPSCALLRTYGWTDPTLSLGYFQRLAEAEDDPRWRHVPKVRRPTGGGALWHDRELTYALVIPRGHALAHESRTLYHVVHDAMAAMLRSAGIGAARRGGRAPAKNGGERPFLCFTGHDSEDIVCGGVKLVGSAQRRRAGAVLQHGSLLLARSPTTPELAGASDLMVTPNDPRFWQDQLERALPAALDLQPRPEGVPDWVRTRATTLEASVYRSTSWLERR